MEKLLNLIAYLLGTKTNIAGEVPVCTLKIVKAPEVETADAEWLKQTISFKDRILKRKITESFNLKIESVGK